MPMTTVRSALTAPPTARRRAIRRSALASAATLASSAAFASAAAGSLAASIVASCLRGRVGGCRIGGDDGRLARDGIGRGVGGRAALRGSGFRGRGRFGARGGFGGQGRIRVRDGLVRRRRHDLVRRRLRPRDPARPPPRPRDGELARHSWRLHRRWRVDQLDAPGLGRDAPGELTVGAGVVDDVGRIRVERQPLADDPRPEVDGRVDLDVLGLDARRLGLDRGRDAEEVERGLVVGDVRGDELPRDGRLGGPGLRLGLRREVLRDRRARGNRSGPPMASVAPARPRRRLQTPRRRIDPPFCGERVPRSVVPIS